MQTFEQLMTNQDRESSAVILGATSTMPRGVDGILTTNLNIQNSGHNISSYPHSNLKNGMSASMLKGQYNYQEMFQDDENAVCGAFDEGEIDKQIMMMTSNCTNLEQAQTKLSWALNLAKEATIENKTMREELDALLLEADRLKLQLEQKKT